MSSRQELFERIASSSIFGNLGLFIGSGFSKAVTGSVFGNHALSWKELLKKVVQDLELNNHSALLEAQESLPRIASQLCGALSAEKRLQYEQSVQLFKKTICRICSWFPTDENTTLYSTHILKIKPSWIITTNYDLVIETLLPGKTVALGPKDLISVSKEQIPVFHMHGLKSSPDSLVVTEEDYVGIFRPNEYRQTKLITLLKESTTVCLGGSFAL